MILDVYIALLVSIDIVRAFASIRKILVIFDCLHHMDQMHVMMDPFLENIIIYLV
jgi:hypothetical protein